MRLPLKTDLRSRDGGVLKDAQLRNSFAEGSDSVLKRPTVSLNATIGSGTAQGGIALGAQVFTVNGDVGLLT